MKLAVIATETVAYGQPVGMIAQFQQMAFVLFQQPDVDHLGTVDTKEQIRVGRILQEAIYRTDVLRYRDNGSSAQVDMAVVVFRFNPRDVLIADNRMMTLVERSDSKDAVRIRLGCTQVSSFVYTHTHTLTLKVNLNGYFLHTCNNLGLFYYGMD